MHASMYVLHWEHGHHLINTKVVAKKVMHYMEQKKAVLLTSSPAIDHLPCRVLYQHCVVVCGCKFHNGCKFYSEGTQQRSLGIIQRTTNLAEPTESDASVL